MKDYGCPFYDGDKVKCDISGTEITGEICYSGGYIYIIHNEDRKHGNVPAKVEDRRGYRYGWEVVDSKSYSSDTWTKGLNWHNVEKVELISKKVGKVWIETVEEPDDEVVFKCKKKRKLNI